MNANLSGFFTPVAGEISNFGLSFCITPETEAIADQTFLSLFVNSIQILPWEPLFPHSSLCDLDLLIPCIAPKMSHDWLQSIPISKPLAIVQRWAGIQAETMGCKEIFAGASEGKKQTNKQTFFYVFFL